MFISSSTARQRADLNARSSAAQRTVLYLQACAISDVRIVGYPSDKQRHAALVAETKVHYGLAPRPAISHELTEKTRARHAAAMAEFVQFLDGIGVHRFAAGKKVEA